MKLIKKDYYNAVKDREKLEKESGCNIEHMMVISERSAGKTYSPLCYAFEQWFKTDGKHQAAYIRRWDTDFNGTVSAKSVYNSLLCNGNNENIIKTISKGMYDTVEYRGGAYYVGRTNESTGKISWNRKSPIGYAFSLNLWERAKGAAYPYCDTILLDEFLTTGMYLRNEFSAIMNLISTIVRDRNTAHIYYMANTISILGYPAWEDWGLQDEVLRLKKGDSRVYTYEENGKETHLALVWLDMDGRRGKSENSNTYFAFNTAATKMITQGDLDIPSYPHLPDTIEIKPMNIVFEFFIEFKKQLFHAELCDIDGNRFTFIHKKTTPIQNENEDAIYTDSIEKSWKDNYSYGFRQKDDKLHTKLRQWLNNFPIYFENNLTGYCFYTYNTQTQDISGKK